MDTARKSRLAEEARRRRRDWVLSHWQPPPAFVTKADVVEASRIAAEGRLQASLTADDVDGWAALSSVAADIARLLDGLSQPSDLTTLSRGGLGELGQLLPDTTAHDDAEPARERSAVPSLDGRPGNALSATHSPSLHGSSSSPITPAEEQPFLQTLLQPAAADIVELIRSFVKSFDELDIAAIHAELPDPDPDYDYDRGSDFAARRRAPAGPKRPTVLSPAERVRAFLTRTEETLRVHPVWRSRTPVAGGAPGDSEGGDSSLPHAPTSEVHPDADFSWNGMCESLEKLVMLKLHRRAFGAHPKAAARDKFLSLRLRSLSFVTFGNLDMPDPLPHLLPLWHGAQVALRQVDEFESPGDKMACIMNCCRILSLLLTLPPEPAPGTATGTAPAGRPVGADDFLPALIYTVLHACPARLYSNMHYIGEFSRPSKLMSEVGYYYTQVLSAVAFARNVTPEHLSMSRDEFDANMARAVADASARARAEIDRGVTATEHARQLGGFSESSTTAGAAAAGTSVSLLGSAAAALSGDADGGAPVDLMDGVEAETAPAAAVPSNSPAPLLADSAATGTPGVQQSAGRVKPSSDDAFGVEALVLNNDARIAALLSRYSSRPTNATQPGGGSPDYLLRLDACDPELATRVMSDYLAAAEDALRMLMLVFGDGPW